MNDFILYVFEFKIIVPHFHITLMFLLLPGTLTQFIYLFIRVGEGNLKRNTSLNEVKDYY